MKLRCSWTTLFSHHKIFIMSLPYDGALWKMAAGVPLWHLFWDPPLPVLTALARALYKTYELSIF